MLKPGTVLKTVIALSVFIFVLVLRSVAGPDVKTIDTAQLHSLVVDNAYRLEAGREKHYMVIDARTKGEYDEAHIFSAINIPVWDLEKLIDLLPKDRKTLLVVYCNDTKFETSRAWAGKAAVAGYANIVVYSEGFSVWKKNHMPIAPLKSGH